MYLNQNIAYYRKLRGYTQEQLAERLGVTGQSVSKWENEITNPDISVLPDLAKALGVDINALFVKRVDYLCFCL
jgi:tellurite methyltransferase